MEGAVLSALSRAAEQKASTIKARLNQKLAALPLEARLGMHQPGNQSVTTFNVSFSTIANLNLGNAVGDLNSSIQQLNTEGRKELGETVSKMTEAIAASGDVDNAIRKELLGHLSVVSGEAAKPAESRKMGPLKTSMEAIKSGVTVGTQLLTLWPGVEHTLKAAGVIQG